MKIKKMYQGTLPENKILNTQSNSQTDTYSCDYINKLNTYSAEEKIIGTWFDKPLYRKIINTNAVSSTDWTEISLSNLGLPEDISFLRIKWASMEKSSGIWEDLYSSGSRIQWLKGNKSLSFLLDMTPTGNIMIEIEYTKTTD